MGANANTAAIEELNWSSNALERLSELRDARNTIDWMTHQAVEECRTATKPISWAKIADELGVSRQTAWQRYR